MENLPTIVTAIGAAIALALGAWLKTKPTFSNKLIPWVTLVISILTQIIQAIKPAEAQVSSAASLGPNWLGVLFTGILAGLGTIGLFSFIKNGVVGKVSNSTRVF